MYDLTLIPLTRTRLIDMKSRPQRASVSRGVQGQPSILCHTAVALNLAIRMCPPRTYQRPVRATKGMAILYVCFSMRGHAFDP